MLAKWDLNYYNSLESLKINFQLANQGTVTIDLNIVQINVITINQCVKNP